MMMTKHSSRKKKNILIAGLIPVLVILVASLGQPLIAQYSENAPKTYKDQYFEHAIVHYETDDGQIMVKSYCSLSQEIKDRIAPPPPPPPAPAGTLVSNKDIKPLPANTIVHLKKNGSITIGNNKSEKYGTPPPPPPPPPAPSIDGVNSPNSLNISRIEGIPPPPPPPVPLKELIDSGVDVYLDGILLDKTKAKALVESGLDKNWKVVFFKEGKSKVEIDTKQ